MRRTRQLLLGAVVALWLVLSILNWRSPDWRAPVVEVFMTLYALIAAVVIWAATALIRRFANRFAKFSY